MSHEPPEAFGRQPCGNCADLEAKLREAEDIILAQKMALAGNDAEPQANFTIGVCGHNLYWQTHYGSCMACRVDKAHAALAQKEADRQYHMGAINRIADSMGMLGETSEAIANATLIRIARLAVVLPINVGLNAALAASDARLIEARAEGEKMRTIICSYQEREAMLRELLEHWGPAGCGRCGQPDAQCDGGCVDAAYLANLLATTPPKPAEGEA